MPQICGMPFVLALSHNLKCAWRMVHAGLGEKLLGFQEVKDFIASIKKPRYDAMHRRQLVGGTAPRWGMKTSQACGNVIGASAPPWLLWCGMQREPCRPRSGHCCFLPLAPRLLNLVLLMAAPFRSVIILVKAGSAVDQTIEQLLKYMEPGDVIIDGGNEW